MKLNMQLLPSFLLAFAVIGLLLTFVPACTREANAPAPGNAADAIDVADLDVNVDVAASPDVSESVADASDTTPAVDPGDAADTADSGPVGLPALCTESLPLPGEPCTELGEFRCTNVDASLPPKFPGMPYCYRPNAVQCVKQADGALRYDLVHCAPAEPPKLGDAALFACMTWQGVDQCWPTYLSLEPNNLVGGMIDLGGKPVPMPPAHRCTPDYQIDPCSGSFSRKCKSLAGTGDFAEGIKKAYGKNAKYLEKGLWILPVLSCHQQLVCPCTPPGPDQECQSIFLAKCTTAVTGEPHCEENCHDVGAKGY